MCDGTFSTSFACLFFIVPNAQNLDEHNTICDNKILKICCFQRKIKAEGMNSNGHKKRNSLLN